MMMLLGVRRIGPTGEDDLLIGGGAKLTCVCSKKILLGLGSTCPHRVVPAALPNLALSGARLGFACRGVSFEVQLGIKGKRYPEV